MFAEYNLLNRFVQCFSISIGVLLLSTNAASAQYKVGDRVSVNGDNGTVIRLGPPVYGGGNQIFVHLDKLGTAYPDSGIMVDPVHSPGVKAATVGATQAAAPIPAGPQWGDGNLAGANRQAQGAVQAAATGQAVSVNDRQAGTDIQVAQNAPPNEETFKNVLRANIPQPGWGDTITLQFQQFNLSGPMAHVLRYAGHLNQETILGGPGRTVQSWKANVKYIQLTHYVDKNADDQAVTKTGDYWFYKDASGHWLAEDENVQLGTTQYIHKN